MRRENQWLALVKLWFFSLAASPAVKLFVKPATEGNGEEEHVICKVDGFYPAAIDIKWEESTLNDPHFRAITEGIITGPVVRNDDGTFSVTSSLALKPALKDHGNTFTCVVSHRSLLDSKRLSVTLPEKSKRSPAPPTPGHVTIPLLPHSRTCDQKFGILRRLGSLLGKERKFGAEGEQTRSSSSQTPEPAVQI